MPEITRESRLIYYAKNLFLCHLLEKFESYLKRVSWHELTCRSFNSHLCCPDVRFSLWDHFLSYKKFLMPVKRREIQIQITF